MLDTRWMMIRSAALLAGGAWLATACGGAAELPGSEAGAGGRATGGSASHAAGGTGAQSYGEGGRFDGSNASGGTSGVSGVVCSDPCPTLACGEGFKSLVQPGACCDTCVPDGGSGGGSGIGCTGENAAGASNACPALACGPGYKSALNPGACCPSCVPDGSCDAVDCEAVSCSPGYKLVKSPEHCCGVCLSASDACSAGRDNYDALMNHLLADPKIYAACNTDADCVWFHPTWACGDPMCAVALSNVETATQLAQSAAANCSTCIVTSHDCLANAPARCTDGLCRP